MCRQSSFLPTSTPTSYIMEHQHMSAEMLSNITHRPRRLLESMITISDPPKPMEAATYDRPSSLGDLDRFPNELLHEVLSNLDFQSITRISRVSRRGRNTVRSLPAYQSLMKHAPDAMAALGQTRLLHLHSASKLLAALQTERCATCPAYGAFLFLPTCERCCRHCLRFHPLKGVMTPTTATTTFALTLAAAKQLPVMLSIPGTYGTKPKLEQTSHELVSVHSAITLSLSLHGSYRKVMAAVGRGVRNPPLDYVLQCMKPETRESLSTDPLMVPCHYRWIEHDPYFGMASVPFPSVITPNTVERGLWCKGCEETYRQYRKGELSSHIIESIVPRKCDPNLALLGLTRRARSRIGHEEHVGHCYGAQRLLSRG
ncbi:hypothetical protein B0I35DRAFT_440397 [Stachybotrys elegans]|uniref:F-box domain-containing protein n=1 Tax=Stachybotrys elegans TaxID=80388 RepID=A0A8K0SHQ6_9HYPO|nr:hypothetical protein B0I35DRAFT_440397 [Stachybotrys elegans]